MSHKYECTKFLGKGKFGKVYMAIHRKTQLVLAMKTEPLNSPMNMLKHETTILHYLSRHSCKHVPRVHWYGVTEMGTALVMTYYEQSLYDAMQIKRFSLDHISKIWKLCLDILLSIHREFVIHRDVKPQNFMLKDGELFLIDFGLATFIDPAKKEHDKKEHVLGTPKYMSFFVQSGNEPHKRDDLISLGYIVLEMAMGELPWSDVNTKTSNETSTHPNTHILHPLHQEYVKQKSWEKMETAFSSVDGMMEITQFMKDLYESS
jgi:serine/threonine protein kinase